MELTLLDTTVQTGLVGGRGESNQSSGFNGYRVLTNDRASFAAWDTGDMLRKGKKVVLGVLCVL